MIKPLDLRQAVRELSPGKLMGVLEKEIERIEDYLEELAEDSSQEAAMEAWDQYLCSLQMLEHYLHNDELSPERLDRICSRAEQARARLDLRQGDSKTPNH
ncbi:MAG: hypothetical protein KF760_22505 [Candidatus Eremiobacteraeota bacterium]|nr:hypothetical protein [Candidatus Eremiobacteraeota bacterium]MCW5866401.1 hypothetical protein [Candidatus Eremiobacteraeota bacterium]